MAGTSAVFLSSNYSGASPVERDGLTWSAKELHLDQLPLQLQEKPSMANALALEGLEDYDVPSNGDVRIVTSINVKFIYFEQINGWVQQLG
ncbi:MAG: hypothetical protein COA42_19405 [Alteromonadaceae bacterium]|nr:MAG: hypothetical protein COA42_19405 [Alteromonadaceae bacterium]